MARPASWALEYKKKKEQVPEQYTVVRRFGGNIGSPMVSQSEFPPLVPMSMGGNGSYQTGAGVDGVVQPGKMAAQAHEGEGIINANAMQNLAPEEFHTFSHALETGKLDKNLFRQAIGMPLTQQFQDGGIVGEEEPVEPLSTNLTPSPKSPSLSDSDVDLIYKNTRRQATGEAFEPYAAKQTQVLGDAARQLQSQNANAIANAGLTGQGAANEMRQQTQGTLLSNLSTSLLDQAMAREDMRRSGTQDLQSLRSYEEVTKPQVDSSLRTNKENSVNERMNLLFNAGKSLEEIKTDPTLQSLLQQDAVAGGVDIGNEIETRWSALQEQSKPTFATNMETLIGDAIDNQKTEHDVLNNDSIRKAAAGFLGVDSSDPQNNAAIENEIRTRFAQQSKSEVDRIYENFIREGYAGDYANVEGFESDMKQAIRDLVRKGVMDSEGNLLSDPAGFYPWEDPDTYFKYTDWNGNEISEGSYNPEEKIKIEGNGETYKTSSGQPVTQKDATAAWEELLPDEREEYFTNGKPDLEKFFNKHFRSTKTENGDLVPVTSRSEYDSRTGDEKYTKNLFDKVDSWVSTGVTLPKEITEDENSPYFGVTQTSENEFVYYDEYGRPQVGNKDVNLGFIWQQLSDKYTNGELMSVDQFRICWGDGSDWRVDSDGNITNLDHRGENDPQIDSEAQKAFSEYLDGGTLTNSQLRAMYSNFDKYVPDDMKLTQIRGYNTTRIEDVAVNYWETAGKNRWDIHKHVRDWVNLNIGKPYKADNGRIYEIVGMDRPKDRKSTSSILFKDIVTDDIIKYSSGGGGSAQRGFTGESYFDE